MRGAIEPQQISDVVHKSLVCRFAASFCSDVDTSIRLSTVSADSNEALASETSVQEKAVSRIRGGCLCSAIRYESDSEPSRMVASDCRHCQKHPGAAIVISVGIPERTLRVRGLIPTVYEDIRPSGSVILRSFCPDCGTPLFTETDGEPIMIFINAATLDDDSWIQQQDFNDAERNRQEIETSKQKRQSAKVFEWPIRDRRVKIS